MDTEEALKQHTREYYRNMYRRDRENEGRMTAAEFARLHKINPWALRRRMRLAGYVRKDNRNRVPIKDLEKFL
jgi:hypothetical protein